MPSRNLVLLTHLRPSGKYRQTVQQDAVDAFWHGYLSLWHPHIVLESAGPPKLGTQEEFEPVVADNLFIIPETPYQYHGTEWQEQQKAAGSIVIAAVPSWDDTQANLTETLALTHDAEPRDWLPFAALGMGYLILDAYCDAQDHSNPLDSQNFYDKVKQAAQATTVDDRQHHLGQAAHLLQEAREVVNPSQLYQAVTLFMDGVPSESKLSDWINAAAPFTLVGSSSWLEEWQKAFPTMSEPLKQQMKAGTIDWWGGIRLETQDALLPPSAWLANLQQGLEQAREWSGKHLESAGRCHFAATPTMPTWYQSFQIKRAIGFSNDSGVWPHTSNSLTAWRGPDSQLLESCMKKPEPLDTSETAFHLGHLLYEAGTAEYVAWLHLGMMRGNLEMSLWFRCWRELHRLAPVFGHLGHLEQTIRDIPATEQFTPANGDDYQSDYLLELTGQCDSPAKPDPISRFVTAQQQWRQWEMARTMASLATTLTPTFEAVAGWEQLSHQLLLGTGTVPDGVNQPALKALASRLMSPSSTKSPGYLIFNACSFARKASVQLPQASTLLPAPAWASQKAEQGIDAVIDVPALGFAWVPLAVEKGAKVRVPKTNLVQGAALQNDYLMLEIDPETGGLRSIRDAVKQLPRLGQQLVFAPGSTMHCDSIKTLRQGHAVGEIQSQGRLLDAHQQVLATFRQTYRLWAGSKMVELDIHLEPATPVMGYPWHAYYGCRWAWRDTQSRLQKSIHHTKLPSMQTRPETPGFIELETPHGRVAIFSAGQPFWQRHSSRMLDTVLLVEGETASDFHFAISLDDDLPHQTAQHWLTPLLTLPTEGMPTAGTSGWFFHIDAPSVLMMDMHPGTTAPRTIIMRLLETYGYATEATLQCPKPPQSARVVDSWGETKQTLTINGDSVSLHLGCYEFQQVALEF